MDDPQVQPAGPVAMEAAPTEAAPMEAAPMEAAPMEAASHSAELAAPIEAPQQNAEAEAKAPPKAESLPSEAVQKLMESLAGFSSDEEKMKALLVFLKGTLAAEGRPRFKDFWDGRRLALGQIHKEGQDLAPALIAELAELSQEARRLKTSLDEQSAATAAQLEQKIQALELDVHHLTEAVRAMPEIEVWPTSLQAREAVYRGSQREAAVLNQLAQRLTALRKDVLGADMRVRMKNQLLARLSTAGDKIYPRRKELISLLSQAFTEDVSAFVQAHFQGEEVTGMLNQHREEIKALQQVAKLLVLNAASFNKTRAQLGEAWDKVKKADLERKRVRQERENASKAAGQAMDEKIAALESKVKEALGGDATAAAAADTLKQEALHVLRGLTLHREQVKAAKDRIFDAVRPLEQKETDAREEKRRAAREQEEAYRKRVQDLEGQLESFLASAESLQGGALQEAIQQMQATIRQTGLLRVDTERLERRMSLLVDRVLQDEVQQAGESDLPRLVKEIKKRRSELRSSVDGLRKSRGGSALDVARGLQLEQDLNLEKQRLDQINQLLYEVETRLYQIQQG